MEVLPGVDGGDEDEDEDVPGTTWTWASAWDRANDEVERVLEFLGTIVHWGWDLYSWPCVSC